MTLYWNAIVNISQAMLHNVHVVGSQSKPPPPPYVIFVLVSAQQSLQQIFIIQLHDMK